MTQSLDMVLSAFGLTLEPWMAPLFAVLIAVAAMPFLHTNFKTKQARKRMLKAAHAKHAEREALHAEALALVEGNPVGQLVVAEEALSRGHLSTARAATEMLGRSGKRRDDYRRLMRQLGGEKPSNPETEALAIERLVERGQADEARERLSQALARWPEAEALLDLRIEAGEARGEASG
ncbi:MAG: hypothetical protein H6740_19290 [Alphaproteobacteria bacterium]|nr:hypothetical protein [Alphaproteobacteria bacterium]